MAALYAAVDKQAQPSHEAIETALVALEKMLHRAGNVDGEGDGCGVLIDIPREIWAEAVRGAAAPPSSRSTTTSRSRTSSSPRRGGNVEQVQKPGPARS